ncbi:glycosyltransferase family 2 protein [Streptomyces sp. GDS52]|uniref:Glycosyltransferase n=1 Tax=Streptomyces cathayae TaxID=3031124 RepID=A0ABY8K398_9ACTN|nr:glycosyltransferase [Streptomyces sp. HUAS 5]WGD40978.1 glycosyltransferase [Streptomyces sp. HUAS 5]
MVPTRGDHEQLRLTLACLAAQAGAPPHEVVVVDDNDRGGEDSRALTSVLEEVRGLLPVRAVAGPGRGRAAARNTGAAAAGAPWIVFLDADVVVGPGFLRAYGEAARPGRFLHGRMRELPSARRLLGRLRSAPLAEVQESGAALHTAPEEGAERGPMRRTMTNALERAIESMAGGALPDVAPWLGLVGANSAVSRESWCQAGGFEESFGRVWGCEDLEFGLRLHEAGLRRHLVPRALGIHLSHVRRDRWEQHSVNMERFTALHPLPSVRALSALLGADGSPERYVAAVRADTPAPGFVDTP